MQLVQYCSKVYAAMSVWLIYDYHDYTRPRRPTPASSPADPDPRLAGACIDMPIAWLCDYDCQLNVML